jgi:hypothetical protein
MLNTNVKASESSKHFSTSNSILAALDFIMTDSFQTAECKFMPIRSREVRRDNVGSGKHATLIQVAHNRGNPQF